MSKTDPFSKVSSDETTSAAIPDAGWVVTRKDESLSSASAVLQPSFQPSVVHSASSWWSTTNWFRNQQPTDDSVHRSLSASGASLAGNSQSSLDAPQTELDLRAATVGGARCFSRFQLPAAIQSVPFASNDSAPTDSAQREPHTKTAEPTNRTSQGTTSSASGERKDDKSKEHEKPHITFSFDRPTCDLSGLQQELRTGAIRSSLVPPQQASQIPLHGELVLNQNVPAMSGQQARTTAPAAIDNRSLIIPGTRVELSCLGTVHPQTRADVMRLVALPLLRPALHRAIGVAPPIGVLLVGPPGSGKSYLARTLARQLGVHTQILNGPDLLVAHPDPTGKTPLDKAIANATENAPAIIIIDDVDAIAVGRLDGSAGAGGAKNESEALIKARSHFQECLDALRQHALQHVRNYKAVETASSNDLMTQLQGTGSASPLGTRLTRSKSLNDLKKGQSLTGHVLFLCTSSLPPSALAPQIVRAGRMDQVVTLYPPDVETRFKLLQIMSSPLQFYRQNATPNEISAALASKDAMLSRLALGTEGLLPSDLESLVTEAGMNAVRRALLTSQGISLDNHTSSNSSAESLDAENEEDDDTIDPLEALRRPKSLDPLTIILGPTTKRKSQVFDYAEGTFIPEACSPELLAQVCVQEDDFLHALARIGRNRLVTFSGSRMGGLAGGSLAPSTSGRMNAVQSVESTTWNSVIGLERAKSKILHVFEQPLKYPEVYSRLGLSTSTGVLLYGTPGSGKSMFARAIAHRLHAAFLDVPCSEILSPYSGGSEANIRAVFAQARAMAPCVIFFDDVETLFRNRGRGPNLGGVDDALGQRIVNQILTELDVGLMNVRTDNSTKGHAKSAQDDRSSNSGQLTTSSGTSAVSQLMASRPVFVLCASNNPALIDPALLRPGRIDHTIYLGLPDATTRLELLASSVGITRKELNKAYREDPDTPFPSSVCSSDITLTFLRRVSGEPMHGWSSADVTAVGRAAKQRLIRRAIAKIAQRRRSEDEMADTLETQREQLRASDIQKAVELGRSSVQVTDLAKIMHFKWLVQHQPPASWRHDDPSKAHERNLDLSGLEDAPDECDDDDGVEIDLLEQAGIPCRSGPPNPGEWSRPGSHEREQAQSDTGQNNSDGTDNSTPQGGEQRNIALIRQEVREEVARGLGNSNNPQQLVNDLLQKYASRR